MFEALTSAVERWLAGEREALPTVEREVAALTVAETIALAAALRDRHTSVRLGWRWARLDAKDAATSMQSTEVAALMSLHRNGFVRAAATVELGRTRLPIALRFLVLRLDDIIEATREHARTAIVTRLDRDNVPELIRLLPLLDQIARRSRASASTVLRQVSAFLAAPGNGWTALIAATHDSDRAVRRSAVQLAVRHAPRAVDRVNLLARALEDPDPEIARWVAIEATSNRVSDDIRVELLPALEMSRDPTIRRRAVLARARLPDAGTYLERALADPHAKVRLIAREKLPGLARNACIAALGDPARRLGALGGLAEVGRPEDATLALPFVDDPDAKIRAEAIRCIGALTPEAHRALLEKASTSMSARVRREATRALARLRKS